MKEVLLGKKIRIVGSLWDIYAIHDCLKAGFKKGELLVKYPIELVEDLGKLPIDTNWVHYDKDPIVFVMTFLYGNISIICPCSTVGMGSDTDAVNVPVHGLR